MATKRIKDITNTATTFASDDFIALDGSTQGTRKMDKDDLISQVSAGVSGDYLEEANNLSDVASKDTSKLNLEVPDVGTAPNEVPLNGQLGSMAYQSSEAVSVDKLEVTDKAGIGNSAPGDQFAGANDLVIGPNSGDNGMTICSGSSNEGKIFFADGASGADEYRGQIKYSHSTNSLAFATDAAEAMRIDTSQRVGIGTSSPSAGLHLEQASTDNVLAVVGQTGYNGTLFLAADGSGKDTYLTVGGNRNLLVDFATSSTPAATGTTKFTFSKLGNLVMTGGGGIDFGSGASTTIDAYEEGTFTGTFRDATSGGNASSTTFPGVYTRIGDVVYFRVGCGNINTSGMTAGNVIYLHGLPFPASASKSGPVNAVQVDTVTTGDYLTVAANAGTSYCDFRKNTSGAGDAQLLVSDLTSGTSDMTVSGWYYA
jgi:hypothetical protein